MAKSPAYHMRVTFFVTVTHWTETSDEVEVLYHTQHGTGLMRSYGRHHTRFPLDEVQAERIASPVLSMIRNRLGGPWWVQPPSDATYVPEIVPDDQTL